MKKFLIDGHCDTITKLMNEGKELMKNDCHIDIEKLRKYDLSVQFFAIWLNQKYYNDALNKTLEYIDFYNNQLEKYSDFINKAETVKDIENNIKYNKISGVLSIEGGEVLEGNLSTLKLLYNLGVRAMTLTWNYDNQIAGGASGNSGITSFGYDVINEMYKLGIIIDVSHLSERSFWEFNDIAKGSYMVSHSNVKSLCSNRRNLSDEQIKAVADKNGIIGINMYSGFLSDTGISTVEDIMNHIDYIIKLIGVNNIGFGCDFDGIDKTPELISDISKLDLVIERIISTYGDTVAEKLLNINFMRVINDVWKI